jgi:tetratricopeptide (TPR) repeat protein
LADIHSRRSHLKTTLGNPTEGVDCANKAIDLLKGLDSCIVDRHPIGLALIARAHAYYAAGATAAAIVDTSTAIAVLNPKKQPHHLFTAFHNLAVYLFEHKDSTPEQLEEAFRHLAIAHRGFRHYSRPHIAKCKLKWLQALIQIRLGAIHRAEENFRTARTGFIKLNAISEVAHISLDLGELLLREGNGKEARQLAFEAFKLGQAHGLHPGALAALKLWLKANDTASRIGSRKQLIHHLQPHGIKRLTA